MADYILAIDQGTTSTRSIIFDKKGSIVASGQLEHEQIFPKAGWVEHDPMEIWRNTREVIGNALGKADLTRHDIAAVGITNQRETAVVWDKNTGEPVYNAIVWQDTRTQPIVDRLAADGGVERFKQDVGLPLATYFSGTKIAWILENVEGARERAEAGDLIFGNTDTWVLWNLTGGVDGGVHATDVTNASRTMFMDLETLSWRDDILAAFGVPKSMMPAIRSSSEVYGTVESSSLLREVPVAGILGDQQAATFGQAAFDAGESKNTYGTGNFLIFNTDTEIVHSKNGLLTTLGYKLGDEPAHYALEGSIAVTGSAVQWLRDQLGIISGAGQSESLARQVEDTGGVYFVPAFSGLFAPYWRSDARGAIVGLSRFNTNAHVARATLEAICYQSRDVVEAMEQDSGVHLDVLKVDGGVTANDLCMQIQA
ncbi:MAG TPA: glycerol kinase GlpK, partial [Agromyces sp.]|nr:glycerol kinase GlpK [Agromyces sp.]